MIPLIISFSFLVFVLISVYQQVYALKEYVNNEYDVKFQYPDESMQIFDNNFKEFQVEYDKIHLLTLFMDAKNNAIEKILIILYSDMPNLKEFVKTIKKEVLYDAIVDNHIEDIKYMNKTGLQYTIININVEDPEFGIFKHDYILFVKDGIGYSIEYVSKHQNTDKYIDNVFNITNQIMNKAVLI